MKFLKKTAQHGRWYDDACGAAFALELVGERWALLILRELMFGGRRFSDLRAGLPGISAKVLTERLEGFERAGIVQRRQLPPPARVQVYELTPWGCEMDETLLALCRWALASPGHDHTLPLSAAAMMMSLQALFDPAKAGVSALSGAIRIGAETYGVKVAGGRLDILRGEPEAPRFTITAPDATPIKRLIYGKAPPDSLASAGLAMSGDGEAALRFVDLFHLPVKMA